MRIESSELTHKATFSPPTLSSDLNVPNDKASASAARTVYMALYLTANLSIK